MLDFLRDVGKHFPVPYMLAKDSVQARLGAGMSFTEFSYMTLQAADFLHLHRDRSVDLQLGGADQWGNITAGLELIRRAEGREEGADPPAFGLCSPLLLTRSGVKMGKSERGAVFLDPTLTSAYEFYQYWIGDEDELAVLADRAHAGGHRGHRRRTGGGTGDAGSATGAGLRPDGPRPRSGRGGAAGAGGRGGLLRRTRDRSRGVGRAVPRGRRL
jgi:hypothetical protein